MDKELSQKLNEAKRAVAEAERTLGPEHPDLATALFKYATLLRQTGKSALDAVNIEARAKAIRARIYAAEAGEPVDEAAADKPVADTKGFDRKIFVGMAAMLFGLCSLLVPQALFVVVAGLALLLGIADVVVSKGVWWRAFIAVCFLGVSLYSIKSLPDNMLTDASPFERLNYATQNPELIDAVKKLDKPIDVFCYKLSIPAGFGDMTQDDKAGLRVISWKGPSNADQTRPQFYAVAMDIPDDVLKKIGRYPLLRLAKAVAVPKMASLLDLDDATVKQSGLQEKEIDGQDFARVEFHGRSADHPTERHAFAYVTQERSRLVIFCGSDWAPFHATSFEPMEASLFTLTRVRGKDLQL